MALRPGTASVVAATEMCTCNAVELYSGRLPTKKGADEDGEECSWGSIAAVRAPQGAWLADRLCTPPLVSGFDKGHPEVGICRAPPQLRRQ